MIRSIKQGTINLLGVLCLLVFLLNAVLLGWLIVRKGSMGLAKCPKCGRTIACPHCADDDEESTAESS